MNDVKKIYDFIEMVLPQKILQDIWDHKISLERDFEHSIFYHTQNFLKAKKLDKKFRMTTNYPIYGTDIMKFNKNGKKVMNDFIMPDIVIRNIPRKESEHDKLYIAMELKNLDPDKTHTKKLFSEPPIKNDFLKLNGLIQEKQICRGYFCYLYFDEKPTEGLGEVEGQIRTAFRKTCGEATVGITDSKFYSSIIPIVINRYYDKLSITNDYISWHHASKTKRDNLHKIYQKTYNYYKGGRPTKRKPRSRSEGAKSAWRDTMYKPDWHVKMIDKRQTTKSRQILQSRPSLAKKVKKKLGSSGINVPVWLKRILRDSF